MKSLALLSPRHALALLLTAAALLILPTGGWAAMSDWASNEGGRMRLVVLDADPQGNRPAVLQIEPNPGWTTYWREPGDSGIPPSITFAPGSPFGLASLSFPVPKRLDIGALRDIGYDAAVSLPMVLTGPVSREAMPLDATVFIGLCRNICIPFQADLAVTLSPETEASAEETAILAEAQARLPERPSVDFAVSGFSMAEDMKQLRLELVLPNGADDRPQIMATGPNGYVFTDYTATSAGDGQLTVELPIAKLPRKYSIAGKTWQVLVISGERAMESPLAFD